MAYQKNTNQGSTHPEHPFRNFFYILWSVLNTFAFVGIFLALATPQLPHRPVILIGCATVVLFALVFGILRPLFGRR